ncbi:MAG TPA: hypothetical protein DEA08_09990, partial [Planctomycetes bacterium]|nr:hypothetical protein [Planctomycetota bacterium]
TLRAELRAGLARCTEEPEQDEHFETLLALLAEVEAPAPLRELRPRAPGRVQDAFDLRAALLTELRGQPRQAAQLWEALWRRRRQPLALLGPLLALLDASGQQARSLDLALSAPGGQLDARRFARWLGLAHPRLSAAAPEALRAARERAPLDLRLALDLSLDAARGAAEPRLGAELLRDAYRLSRGSSALLPLLLERLRAAGEPEEARALQLAAIRAGDERWEGFARLARWHHSAGRHAAARRALSSVLDLRAGAGEAQRWVSDQLRELGYEQESLATLRDSLERSARAGEDLGRYVERALELGREDLAAEAFEWALAQPWLTLSGEDRALRAAVQHAPRLQPLLSRLRRHDLQISATWDQPLDVDLIVLEPEGTFCRAGGSSHSTAGGRLLDDRDRGPEDYYRRVAAPGAYRLQLVAKGRGPTQVQVRVRVRALVRVGGRFREREWEVQLTRPDEVVEVGVLRVEGDPERE